MALQQFVCRFTVVIIFFCKGCHSEQPECGIRAVNSSNITGAHDAAPGSWPWFANVHLVDGGSVMNKAYCAGSLITDQWVLTRGFLPQTLVVYLGRNSRSDSNPNEVYRTLEKIICDPSDTICLLKLSAPVNFTNYIRPTCLASENSTFNDETSSWAIGYMRGVSNNLKEASVSILGNNECTASYPELRDSIICTRASDLCWNTFGAPLMTQSESVWLQSGLLTVIKCDESLFVYTALSQYQKWISKTVTGTPPGFVTFPSPHSSLQTTAPPTAPPTTPPTAPSTTSPTAPPIIPTCVGVFCSGENLIHFTYSTSLCVLVVLLHVFAGTVGN